MCILNVHLVCTAYILRCYSLSKKKICNIREISFIIISYTYIYNCLAPPHFQCIIIIKETIRNSVFAFKYDVLLYTYGGGCVFIFFSIFERILSIKYFRFFSYIDFVIKKISSSRLNLISLCTVYKYKSRCKYIM